MVVGVDKYGPRRISFRRGFIGEQCRQGRMEMRERVLVDSLPIVDYVFHVVEALLRGPNIGLEISLNYFE